MNDDLHSARHEPALGHGQPEPSGARHRLAPPRVREDDIERLRDSVFAEPALDVQFDATRWAVWLAERRGRCTLWGNLGVTLVAAAVSGPAAIVGALFVGRQTWWGLVYLVLFGPVIEELLKQSGMIYLLEKKPYRLFAWWQFVFAALVSGTVFATIENLVYLYVYAPLGGVTDIEGLAAYRWTVCIALHVICSAIASLGLVRGWRKMITLGRPFELGDAFPLLAAAIALHGVYNLAAALLFDGWQ